MDSTPLQQEQTRPRRVKQPKGGKKKKGGAWNELVDEGMNAWSVAQFRKLFASKQGQKLSLKVAAGGWYNVDSTYLAVLLTGRVMCDGQVLSLEQAVQVGSVKKDIDLNGDLLHQGCGLQQGAAHVQRMGAVRVAARGGDYAGVSYARASPVNGAFEIVCQHQSQVFIDIEVDPQPGSNERGPVWNFGPFQTGELGDILDVGALEIDFGGSRL